MLAEDTVTFVKNVKAIGELRVDVSNGSADILSDNKARYHRPTGFTAHVGNHKAYASREPNCLTIDTFCSIQPQSSNPLMDLFSYIRISLRGRLYLLRWDYH